MKIISVVGQKGGVGKSTIAGNLASLFSKKYKKVAVADVDPQGSLANWHKRRESNTNDNNLAFIPLGIKNISKGIADLEDAKCDVLIIDTLPVFADYMEDVINASDLIILPCKPSLSDIETIPRVLKTIKDKPFIVVINEAKNNTRVLSQASQALREMGVFVGKVSSSVDMAQSWSEGVSVNEFNPSNVCSEQYQHIFKYVDSYLNKKLRKSA